MVLASMPALTSFHKELWPGSANQKVPSPSKLFLIRKCLITETEARTHGHRNSCSGSAFEETCYYFSAHGRLRQLNSAEFSIVVFSIPLESNSKNSIPAFRLENGILRLAKAVSPWRTWLSSWSWFAPKFSLVCRKPLWNMERGREGSVWSQSRGELAATP